MVGYATDSNHPLLKAVLLSDGQATFLGTTPGAESLANAISDSGMIVGDMETPTGFCATVYDPVFGLVNLNSLLINGAGWTLKFAHSINNEGQIADIGRHNGIPSAYLLMPVTVPEPGTLALFGVALLGLGASLRRQWTTIFRV